MIMRIKKQRLEAMKDKHIHADIDVLKAMMHM